MSPRVRPVTPRAAASAVLVVGAALGACLPGACARDAAPPARAAGPAAEFLVAAGDSTYWVTNGPAGVRMRAAPLFLARWDGRLAEVYVADDERAFDDGAVFAAERVYRRDLVSGDSTPVFADPAVPRLAARYAVAHPDVRLLAPDDEPAAEDEDAAEHPAPSAVSTVALAGAHGPFLSVEQRTTVDGLDPAAAGGADQVLRRVIDLRTGHEVALDALFGRDAARALATAGHQALAAAVDSIRPVARRALRAAAVPPARHAPADLREDRLDDAPATADAARRALAALATLRFDIASFGLTARGGAPAVTFVAVGRDADGAAVTLPLPPLLVPGAEPRWWSDDVRQTLFIGPGADATAAEPGRARDAQWRPAAGLRGGARYEVRARVADDGAVLELVTGPARPVRLAGGPGAPAASATAVGRAVTVLGRVPAPLQHLLPLDGGVIDAPTRRALRRAFDESAFYDDVTTSVAWTRPRPDGRHGRW